MAKNTSNNPDVSDEQDYGERLKVDVSFYPVDEDAKRDYTQRRLRKPRAATRWAWISMLVEIKTDHTNSALWSEDKKRKKKDDKGKKKDGGGKKKGGVRQKKDGKGKKRDDGGKKKAGEGSEDRGGGAENHNVPQESAAEGKGKGRAPDAGDPPAPKPFVRTGDSGDKALGQVGEYVAKLFRRQHRTHVFTLYVFKGQARVIRSDRAGSIVSTAIDFEEDPSLLHKVIWRYASMTQAQRGFDPSVVRATKEEIEAMKSCPTRNEAAMTYRSAALDKPGWLVYKIKMRRTDLIEQQGMCPIADEYYDPDEPSAPDDATLDSDEPCFIVGRHHSATDSPTGRGMRGYVAYDVSHRRLVFLKDYWRPRIESSPYEGEVLRSLRSSGVQHVPTPLAAGVVRDEAGVQKTCTQAFLPVDEKTGCYAAMQEHYRLVVKEIGEPLDAHETPYELVKTIFHALKGTCGIMSNI